MMTETNSTRMDKLREQYEPYVHALSSFLLMPLPEWLPPAHESPAWHRIA